MKILSYQSFSLFVSSGGGRILRRLYEGYESDIFSLTLNTHKIGQVRGNIPEKVIPLIPVHRSWMRWKIREGVKWLRENVFDTISINKIKHEAKSIQFDILHVVDHGPFSSVLCSKSFLSGKPLWVSFHDHFSTTGGSFQNSQKLWDMADRRLVISNEMGKEYQRIFGNKSFEVITDGVLENEISKPVKVNNDGKVIIYFAGLLHIDYLPLFKVLAEALDLLADDGLQIKLILRGTQDVNFLADRHFEIEYRPVTTNYNELKEELDAATILYLPIKFTTPDFYLYSLSTKMVGYLGGSGSILYHGPDDSAAGNLLNKTGSAICCNSLDTTDMINSLKAVLDDNCKVSFNAKTTAENEFNLLKIRQRFWQPFLNN
jgi:hypothetical protein